MRSEKTTIVADLKAKLDGTPFLLVIDYAGLKVSEFGELRTRLAAAGSECRVVKNTMLRKAMAEAGWPDIGGQLNGQTAIVIGERDVAAAAKTLKSFAAEFKKPAIKLGVVDRLALGADQVHAIADLPSREVLLAQLLGVLQAPATRLVRVLTEPASALARVLQAKSEASAEKG